MRSSQDFILTHSCSELCFSMPGFPVVGGLEWDPPPHYLKNWLAPPPLHAPPHCFDPKMPILLFSCSFWPFCPNSPPPVDPIWETLHASVVNDIVTHM